MEEPRPRIVGEEPDCDVIPSVANTHDVSDNRVDEVVGRVTSAAYHLKIVPVQMDRVLLMEAIALNLIISIVQFVEWNLTGESEAPPGMVSSTLLFAASS